MNASRSSAKRGYAIYLKRITRPGFCLRNLNSALVVEGLDPVSPRMWKHYGSLRRVGLTRYVPINRFDVLRAKEGGIK